MDCTRQTDSGYGPEEYMIRTAQQGLYRIQVVLLGFIEGLGGAGGDEAGQDSLLGGDGRSMGDSGSFSEPTTVSVSIVTNYGRPSEHSRQLTLRLSNVGEVVDLGKVHVLAPHATPSPR